MEEIENTPSLMNKKADELTVADNLKLVAIVAATFVAIPIVAAAGSAAVTSFVNWRQRRKFEKLADVETPEVETV